MRTETLVFGLLLLVGLATVGYGQAQGSEMRMTVEPVGEGQLAADDRVVAYEDLTDREQRLFDRARDGGGAVTYPTGRWSTRADAIRDGDQYYGRAASLQRPKDRYAAVGFGLVTLAIVGFGGTRGIRRLRSR